MDEQVIASLEDLWPLQASLNARAGFDTLAMGRRLVEAMQAAGLAASSHASASGSMPPSAAAATSEGKAADAQQARLAVGRALKNYIDAMASECHELQDCLSWKHWYKEARQGRQHELQDLQNARVEAVDLLFFWVSICQLLGLEPADVYRLYAAKLGINHRRQDEDRSQAQHASHEHENRGVL